MHVGAAAGVPTVGLFGSSNPAWTGPYGGSHRALWGRVPCAPCYRRTCVPGRNYACLDAIGTARVRATVLDALARSRTARAGRAAG
jgi:heptosyltransferase-2